MCPRLWGSILAHQMVFAFFQPLSSRSGLLSPVQAQGQSAAARTAECRAQTSSGGSAQVREPALVPEQCTAASQQVQQCSSPQSCLQFWSYFGCFLHVTTSCPQKLTLSNVEVRVKVVKPQLGVCADEMRASMQG